MSGDTFNRIEVAPGQYQCGCRWERHAEYGDVLKQCPIHQQASDAKLREVERQWQKEGKSHLIRNSSRS